MAVPPAAKQRARSVVPHKKDAGLKPNATNSEAAADSQEWLSHLPRNKGHEASCPQERCWAKAQRCELGGRGQPGMAVPPISSLRP